MEVVAQSMAFKTHIRNFKVKLVVFIYLSQTRQEIRFEIVRNPSSMDILKVVNTSICFFQMRVEGLSENKTSHFSVILEVSFQFGNTTCLTLGI